MTDEDIRFLETIGLTWPPPDRITAALPLPAGLDARIAARYDDTANADAS